MDNKKILLVNLSKGRSGELNSKLLGMVFVMKFQAAAMSRADIPESQRQDFSLYVDEFQNFSTDSFATIMSEARKYHLNLIVANQFTTQLTEEIRDAVFGNMGTIVAFRVGQNDVDALTRYFQPTFDADDLLRVPNYNTITRTLIGGVPTQPFSMATLPPLGTPNPKLATALKQLSAAKYGHPKAEVEKTIFARMATKAMPPVASPNMPRLGGATPPSGQWGAPAPGASGGQFGSSAQRFAALPATSPQTAPKPPAPASFLDEWLTKRKTPGMAPAGPAPIGGTGIGAGPTVSSSRPPMPPQGAGVAAGGTNIPNMSTAPSSAMPAVPSEKFAPSPITDAPAPSQPEQQKGENGTNTSQQPATHGHLTPGDTIYIDREGNLHQDNS